MPGCGEKLPATCGNCFSPPQLPATDELTQSVRARKPLGADTPGGPAYFRLYSSLSFLWASQCPAGSFCDHSKSCSISVGSRSFSRALIDESFQKIKSSKTAITISRNSRSFISRFSIYRRPFHECKHPQAHKIHQRNKHQKAPPAAVPGSPK